MKFALITSATVLAALFSGAASAACTDARLNQQQISTLLTGNTVCVLNSRGGWEAQEQHLLGGVLKDFKLGPLSKTDPTETIGSWTTSGNGTNAMVSYTYNGGSSYSYSVHGTGTVGQPHSFCGSTNVEAVKVMSGTASGC